MISALAPIRINRYELNTTKATSGTQLLDLLVMLCEQALLWKNSVYMYSNLVCVT